MRLLKFDPSGMKLFALAVAVLALPPLLGSPAGSVRAAGSVGAAERPGDTGCPCAICDCSADSATCGCTALAGGKKSHGKAHGHKAKPSAKPAAPDGSEWRAFNGNAAYEVYGRPVNGVFMYTHARLAGRPETTYGTAPASPVATSRPAQPTTCPGGNCSAGYYTPPTYFSLPAYGGGCPGGNCRR